MLPVRQHFPATPLLDVVPTVRAELGRLQDQVQGGARIAVAVGSRGIADLALVVRTVIESLKAAGAAPFILPAMGSHGGATPQGQTQLLAEYGITAESLGIPIRAAMEVEQIGTTPEGVEVWCSVEALRADGIVLINRIKPHTDFRGDLGSGIIKMMVIGLGKRAGAARFHVAAGLHGYEPVLRSIGRVILRRASVLGAVALLENQRHELASISVLRREEIESGEEALFQKAKRLMPKLPLDDIDFLIVDRMGKNISGAGMDPNIIGRGVHGYSSFLGQKDQPSPRIKRIFVRDLTPETHGNAIGLGFADLTTTRLVQAMDRRVTYINALTSLTPNGAKIPIHFDTDREAIELGLNSLGLPDTTQARVVRISDTLSLERLDVSEACLPEMQGRPDLSVEGNLEPMPFDAEGNLAPRLA